MDLDIKNTLGQWASNFAGASRVFVKHDLDFCCGGQKGLNKACDEKGLNPEEIVNEIVNNSNKTEAPPWNQMVLANIVDEILERFHKKHREDLQMLIPLAKKVESVHADRNDCPKGLGDFLELLLFELDSHMQKEEQILFPMIKAGQGAMADGPIQVMMHEHIEHGENLAKLKQLAKNYVLPEDACGSWKALYNGVATLEREIKEHIATENNVLFPKALNQNSPDGCCGSCS